MHLKAYDLTGRVALVTGGGTNLGAAIATLLAETGANVIIAARRLEPLEATAAKINAMGRGHCAVMQADVTQSDQVEMLIKKTVDTFGGIDILVNNVGNPTYAPIPDISDEMWDASLSVNLNSTFYCSRAAYPHLKKSGRGAIVNISSMAAVSLLNRGGTAYATAKAGMQMFTRSSAAEWGPDGIRVNCVAPGYFPTEINRERLIKSGMDPEAACRIFALKRTGKPEELAHAVHFLACDASSYITGETLAVGGGTAITS